MIDPISLLAYAVGGAIKATVGYLAAHSTATATGVAVVATGVAIKKIAENNALKEETKKALFALNAIIEKNEKLRSEIKLMKEQSLIKEKKLDGLMDETAHLKIAVDAANLLIEKQKNEIDKWIDIIQEKTKSPKDEIIKIRNKITALSNDNLELIKIATEAKKIMDRLEAEGMIEKTPSGIKLFERKSMPVVASVQPEGFVEGFNK